MNYVNFIDKNGRPFIDFAYNEFLVRDFRMRIIKNASASEIEKIVKSRSMKCSFHLYSLYDDETIKEDLSDYILVKGNYSNNYNNGLRRKLSISIYNAKNWIPSPIEGFLWKGSKFKFEISIETASAEYVFPAGVFILQDFEFPHKYSNNEINLQMVDKFGGLDGTVGGNITDSIYIPRGSNIVQIIKSLLKSTKIRGSYFDTIEPLFPSWAYNSKTTYTITESTESTIGALIIKLLTSINLEVYYDVYGRLCTENMRENMLVDSSASLWSFSDEDGVFDFHTTKVDLQSVENVVEVIGANMNGDIVSVKIENTNPKSPTNITIFEPKIKKIVDENISNAGDAYLRADYELFKRSLMSISSSFSTALIPSLDVNKIVTINDKYCGLKNARFLIDSIDIPISETASMNLVISNLEEVAFNVL